MAPDPVFVRRVTIQNYKSIKACRVGLGPLTVLVGANGSGKSNFLDALRLVADALGTTLDHALRDRGGVDGVRRRSGGHPTHFQIRLDLTLPSGSSARYSFRVGAASRGGFSVTHEECAVLVGEWGPEEVSYRIERGRLTTTLEERLPAVASDRLYLVSASNVGPFREVYDALVGMGFYNLSPSTIRQPQPPDPGALLRRDGSNLASVLGNLASQHPETMQRVIEYLRQLAPGVDEVTRKGIGPLEGLEFRQRVAGQKRGWRFAATNMSDGTLRGLGVLVALLQANGRAPTLVAIEEPEVALHPAALGVLVDAIRDAAIQTQVLATSHSPELLDRPGIGPGELLAVEAVDGITTIGPVDAASIDALRSRLFTAGELLRLDQLEPSAAARQEAQAAAPQLFGP